VLLTIIEAALIVVGSVSHALNVHMVQTAPLLLALIVIALNPDMGVNIAAPLFAFWFLVMGGIWLFLLGIAPAFTGTFTTTEIARRPNSRHGSSPGAAEWCATSRRPLMVRSSWRKVASIRWPWWKYGTASLTTDPGSA